MARAPRHASRGGSVQSCASGAVYATPPKIGKRAASSAVECDRVHSSTVEDSKGQQREIEGEERDEVASCPPGMVLLPFGVRRHEVQEVAHQEPAIDGGARLLWQTAQLLVSS